MTNADTRTTVVVASAEATVCEVLARVVEAAGHEAVRVTDAGQVSSAVLSAPADAVVLDLGPDNAEQLTALRTGGAQRGIDVRAVVLGSGPANARVAWQEGADAVLTRPFPADLLVQELHDALARSDDARRTVRSQQVQAHSG